MQVKALELMLRSDINLIGAETEDDLFNGSSAIRAKRAQPDAAHNGWPPRYVGPLPSFSIIAYSQWLYNDTVENILRGEHRELTAEEKDRVPAPLKYPKKKPVFALFT